MKVLCAISFIVMVKLLRYLTWNAESFRKGVWYSLIYCNVKKLQDQKFNVRNERDLTVKKYCSCTHCKVHTWLFAYKRNATIALCHIYSSDKSLFDFIYYLNFYKSLLSTGSCLLFRCGLGFCDFSVSGEYIYFEVQRLIVIKRLISGLIWLIKENGSK